MKTTALTAEDIFEQHGLDENGRDLNALKDEYYPGDETRHRDHFGRQQAALAPDDDDREVSRDSVEDMREAAKRDEERAKVLLAQGKRERAKEALKQAHELRELADDKAHNVLRTHELFSEAFSLAVEAGHWHIAQAHLIDAVKSDEADYALKVASVKALAEIATFAGDTGADFDGRWLAGLAGIPLRSAQDLIASARDIESGVAVILTGTEHGSRKAVRKLADMTPARRREAVAAVKQCLTRYLLENAIAKERKQRARNISISELRALAFIGCNNEEGWHKLTTLSIDEGNAWLAAAVDETLRKRVLSERTEERAKQTLSDLKSRLQRNATPTAPRRPKRPYRLEDTRLAPANNFHQERTK
jgi:tetratricopeptide (TPR) repeat protein